MRDLIAHQTGLLKPKQISIYHTAGVHNVYWQAFHLNGPSLSQITTANGADDKRTLPSGFVNCSAADVDVRYYRQQNYLFHMLSLSLNLSLSLYVIYQLQTYVGNNFISVMDGHQRFLSVTASYYICIPLSYTQRLEGVFIRVTT